MIEKLKRAARFIDEELETLGGDLYAIRSDTSFNPDEEEGTHWLKKMLRKLPFHEKDQYIGLMEKEYQKLDNPDFLLSWWLVCEAPTELCFEKIMEVI